jgi:hypothetical protein
MRAGVLTTWAVAAFALAYLLLTPDGPNREIVFAIVVVAGFEAFVIDLLTPRLITERTYERFLTAWNTTHIAVGAVLCHLDGGPGSPFFGIFFISVAFAAGGLPRPKVVVIAVLNVVAIVALVLLEAHGGAWHAPSVLWGGTLVVIAGVCATIAQHRTSRSDELRDAREEIPRRLARVVEYRDNDTGGHIERMGEYSGLIAAALGLSPHRSRQIQLASTMHDIGKVAVPDSILLKPGKLTAYERAVMERHAQVGHDMLSGSGSELLDLAATIALTHHERFDGAGYPRKLEADQIPLAGRIVAVADVFDAVTSKRVYKDAEDLDTAVQIIRDGRGTQFDPRVVSAFNAALDDIIAARERYADAQVPGSDELPVAA